MSSTTDAILRSWPFDPWILGSLLLTGAVYLRGWRALFRRDPRRWPVSRLVWFAAGLIALFLALASPIETFASLLLQVHMLQHLLLMMIAPPFLWLGAPQAPLLLGLPRPVRAYWAAPLVRWPALRQTFQILTHPAPAWLLYTGSTWIWHLPPVYGMALRSDGWHYLQHASFLSTALLFWYPVIRPFPSRPRWSEWLLVPYLILADLQNTLLSAWLTFSERPLYHYYLERPRLGNLSTLEDQAAAGVLMWVPGSVAFLVPLFVIGIRLLVGRPEISRRRPRPAPTQARAPRAAPARLSLPILGQPQAATIPARFDLLNVPLLGHFLRWRHARVSMQLPLLVLAGLVVFDGLRGPSFGAMNLAGVLPWIHWRGLVIVGLLAAGNVFCMACPFMLPRLLARRLRPPALTWPRWLRNKWLAVVLLAGFFWAYEAFALWDSPWLSAWIVLAYFTAALVVDGCFRGASFCKYVCPIGQFNFVQSFLSPLEVKVREPAVCESCRTKDCIRGRDEIPGCEMHLYQPRKSSNMDCTFCLDCLHACPHQNIGILAGVPSAELWRDANRSGLGRLSRRFDVAALVVVLVSSAFASAALMTAPVLSWEDRAFSAAGVSSPVLSNHRALLAGLSRSARASWWEARRFSAAGEARTPRARRRSRPGMSTLSYPWALACGWRTTAFTSSRAASRSFRRPSASSRIEAGRSLGRPSGGAGMLRAVFERAHPVGDPVSRSGTLAFALHRVSNRPLAGPSRLASAQDRGAVGGAHRGSVCPGDLDRVPADADARHHADREVTVVRQKHRGLAAGGLALPRGRVPPRPG